LKKKACHRSSGLYFSHRILCRLLVPRSYLRPACPLRDGDLPAGRCRHGM